MINIKNDFVKKEAINLIQEKYPSLKKIDINIEEGKTNKVAKNGNALFITAKEKVYVFRMLSFAIDKEEDFEVEENPDGNRLTYYCDCSRNGVINFDYFKDMVITLALLGYNNLSLYTEDTIEVDNEPYFGHMRGRYSKEEIKEMVKYAKDFGITLIPGIATLAHLDNIFFWPEYEPILDNANTILIGEDRTYVLFDNIFKTLSEVFEAREVHIGFDEAHTVCLGKYYEKHGAVDRVKVTFEHLKKINEIAKKYGFKCSMWSDMFFRLAYDGKYYIDKDASSFSDEIKAMVPNDIELVYWDYYHNEKDIYNNMIKRHFELSNDIAFAGGAWNWLGFAPLNKRSLEFNRYGIKAAKEEGVKKIYLTSWGDNGNECARGAIIPSLVLYAESYNSSKDDDETISKRIQTLTGLTLDDFETLDILNEYKDNVGCKKMLANPAKFVVYNDPMFGVFDKDLVQEQVEYFKDCYQKIKACAAKKSDYQYIFKVNEALASLMIDKTMIGNELYKAYKENDKKFLKIAKDKILPTILKKTIIFEKLLREQWFKENKTIGFDVIQIRLGGQKNRIEETINRLKEYLSGKIDRIEELEIPKLTQRYSWEDDLVYKHNYNRMALPNVNIT